MRALEFIFWTVSVGNIENAWTFDLNLKSCTYYMWLYLCCSQAWISLIKFKFQFIFPINIASILFYLSMSQFWIGFWYAQLMVIHQRSIIPIKSSFSLLVVFFGCFFVLHSLWYFELQSKRYIKPNDILIQIWEHSQRIELTSLLLLESLNLFSDILYSLLLFFVSKKPTV